MVNVNDFKEEVYGGGDMLQMIFGKQTELCHKYEDIQAQTVPDTVPEKIPVPIDSHLGQHQIKCRIFWAINELCEAADCLKNKPWKLTMMETDVTHYKEELADALHFFVEACILSGMGAEELFSFYMRKAKVNEFRQNSNY